MKITRRGELYQISRVTGPTHNYLGLTTSPGHLSHPPRVVACTKDGEAARIAEAPLLAAVQAGVEDASRSIGWPLSIALVEYVTGDTPDYALYQVMARLLALAAWQDSQDGNAETRS